MAHSARKEIRAIRVLTARREMLAKRANGISRTTRNSRAGGSWRISPPMVSKVLEVSEESLDLLDHPVKDCHLVTLDVVKEKKKTDLKVQVDRLVRSATKICQVQLVARARKETWDRRVLSIQLVLLEKPVHPARTFFKVNPVLKDLKEKLVTLDSQVHLVRWSACKTFFHI